MSVIDEIKAHVDIVDVIGQSVQLKKAGRNYKGLCPFHSEKTPSFVVFPDQGSWHCFGACGTGGDVFSFVMKRDNLDFGDALRLLAERAGVELHRDADADQNRQALLDIHEHAANYFHYVLKHHAAAQYAREYLRQRRINRESIETFQLGFALSANASLREHLETKGFRAQEIERAGLVFANESGSYRDRFRGRLMFPIRNRRGQTIAFGARALEPEQQPKYLNSPDTPLFSKSDVLYGLDLAKDAIRNTHLAVIVEGYTDVVIAHQEGFKNVVAALGTALTEKQLSQLQRLTKRYALALDADVAGEAATERGLELARAALNRKQVPVPVGPGLIGFEERLEAELLIIELPPGRDPDEVILDDRAQWQELVDHALPLVDYYFRAQTRDLDVKTARGKTEAVRRLLPVIAEMNDAVERGHYLQELARLVQTDERVLAQQLESRGDRVKTKQVASTGAPAVRAGAKYDEHLLSLLFYDPAQISRVDFLEPDDFQNPAAREIWQALRQYLFTSRDFDSDEFLDRVSAAARAEAARFRDAAQQLNLSEADTARELEAAAYRLRLQRYRDELTQLQFALEDTSLSEQVALYAFADALRQHIAETQRALNARTVLKSSAFVDIKSR